MSRAAVQVIAHRGGALLWPENSRAACRGAAALGVDAVQLDVHPTRDGAVAVIHDATLDRTTDGTGPVSARSQAELPRLRDAPDEGVPGLEEMAALLRPSAAALRLEIKRDPAGRPYPGFAVRVMETVRAAGLADRCVLSAFEPDDLLPGWPSVRLVGSGVPLAEALPALIRDARARGLAGIGVRWTALTPGLAAQVREAGLTLGCFGCHGEASLRAALRLGVDDVSTDRPDLALRLRDEPGA